MSSLANGRTGALGSIACTEDPARFIPCSKNLPNTVASVAMPDLALSLKQLHGAELGASRRRIVPDFLFRRTHDVPGEHQGSTRLRHSLKTLLDLAVLERHEGKNHGSPSRLH